MEANLAITNIDHNNKTMKEMGMHFVKTKKNNYLIFKYE